MIYITGFYDSDIKLIKFLDLADIINLSIVNCSLNELVISSKIYPEIIQLKKIKKDNILICCYCKGLIQVLKNYYRNGKNILTGCGLDLASASNHIIILDWFKNSGLKFKYSKSAIDLASENNHVAILDWFKNSDFEFKFKYSEWAIDHASEYGHVVILDWFKKSNFEFKYSEWAINYA